MRIIGKTQRKICFSRKYCSRRLRDTGHRLFFKQSKMGTSKLYSIPQIDVLKIPRNTIKQPLCIFIQIRVRGRDLRNLLQRTLTNGLILCNKSAHQVQPYPGPESVSLSCIRFACDLLEIVRQIATRRIGGSLLNRFTQKRYSSFNNIGIIQANWERKQYINRGLGVGYILRKRQQL